MTRSSRSPGLATCHRALRVAGVTTAVKLALVLRLSIVLVLAGSFWGIASAPAGAAAAANQPDCTRGTASTPGAGQRVIALDCQPGFATAHDRVTIYERGPAVPGGSFDGLNATNAVWVFDVGAQGRASLIIDFHPDGQNLVADLYDDEDGDRQVSYRLVNGVPVVTERPALAPRFVRRQLAQQGGEHLAYRALPANAPRANPRWTVRVVSLEGRWVRDDGSPTMNLDIYVDGPVLAQWGVESYLDRLFTDGHIDFVINVRDPKHDGRPQYEISNAYPNVPDSWGIYRTAIMVNTADDEPLIQGGIFWPLLGSAGALIDFAGGTLPTTLLYNAQGRNYGIVKGYGQSFPPIQVDWLASKIVYIGEFVASRGGTHNWFTYSTNRVKPDQVTDPNFESPFAFYKIGNGTDPVPDLEIRAERQVPNDPYAAPQWRGRAYQMIRYSWEQQEGQGWTYKLGLLGQHQINTLVQLPGYTLKTIPYAQFPQWVTSNRWDIATFVAIEGGTYNSTEGIYDWDPSAVRDKYYAGIGSAPSDPFTQIGAGRRGEYTLNLGTPPWLYFSPIDARLHLLGASAGLYNIDGTRRVEYQSLAANGYIDSWQLFDGNALSQQLYQVPGGLLYAADGQVSLLTAQIQQEVFRTLPPTNRDEWVTLGQQLDANKKGFAADDLAAMFNQFTGQRSTVTGATLSDFRFTDAGYRFVLDLQPGFNLGGFPVASIGGPGSYVVTYDTTAGRFTAQPLTPAAPAISGVGVPKSQTALTPMTLRLQLANAGNADMSTLPVIVTASRPGRPPIVIVQKPVTLLGGEQPVIEVPWTPPGPGNWTVTARLYLPGNRSVERSVDLRAASPPQPAWQQVIRGGWPANPAFAFVVALVGLAGLGTAGGLLLGRRLR